LAEWPTALDWAEDNGDSDINRGIIEVEVRGAADTKVPRCDAALEYELSLTVVKEESYCHRYGLIWQPVLKSSESTVIMDQQIDWSPALTDENDSGFRLPTIKELIRLVDYDYSDGTRGFTDTLIAYWLTSKCAGNGGDCTYQNVTLADGLTSELKDGYLISSSYVNIDGNDDDGFAQLLGVRIKDGKVAIFESGAKGSVFSGHPNQSSMLTLCLGLIVDSDGQITGGCDFRVNGDDGEDAAKNAADQSIVPVFALLVKDIP